MIGFMRRRCGPIGIDIGSRTIKLVQFSADRRQLVEAARWEWHGPPFEDSNDWSDAVAEALRAALAGRAFQGKKAVLGLNDRQLFIQSIRVAKSDGDMQAAVEREVAGRVPFPLEESMLDYWESADIRQGESLLREVIVFACQRAVAARLAHVALAAGLCPIAIDVEPAALIRSYCAQFRRDDERTQKALLVHIGYHSTGIVICQFDRALFVKYVDIGGKHLDECAASALKLSRSDTHALRRQLDHADADVARQLLEGMRPAVERLVREISLCVRYYSVTFRGRGMDRLLLQGGEASRQLAELLGTRLGLPAIVSDPFRRMHSPLETSHPGLWDVAAGLALREDERSSEHEKRQLSSA